MPTWLSLLMLLLLLVNLNLTALLLLAESRRKLVQEVVREAKNPYTLTKAILEKGSTPVVATKTRESKELGVSIAEGGAYSFPPSVADELVHRGWAMKA